MDLCETCAGHDRPEVLLSQALAQARALAPLLRGAAAALMDERTRSVARTVVAMAENRRIADDRCGGPVQGLVERLDRVIAASTRPVPHLCVVGAEDDGPVYETVLRDEIDPAMAPLVALRDQARAVVELIERACDAVAADEAIFKMRDAMRR
ncbi:hypothetical protein [Rubrimonas cliftonensis]|uniref:Uncharacterized protein n=1 Tax=Rubrimonas cliftonensis TaxID=89524 RepID=A0A1H4G8Y6_9RHOB|nr:hypothetical protein [Rubrimonas cliftonensis]SEB05741.1 hypothetical protein SAMN05444370_1425 [Rubrimonas cliftonensis]